MAEFLILPMTNTILEKLATFVHDLTIDEIKGIFNARKNLKKMENKLSAMCAILKDAEQKQYGNESIKVWLHDLKKVVYDIDDLLDEVSTYALQHSANKRHWHTQIGYFLFSNPILFRYHMSQKINELNETLDEIEANKRSFGLTEHSFERQSSERLNPLDTFSYVNVSDIIGRDEAKQEIIDIISGALITCNNDEDLIVLSLVGFGGIGKTALAKLLFNDEWVSSNFDMKLWACVSHKLDIRRTIEDIIKSCPGEDISTSNLNIGQLHERLRFLLNGRKYFLVLDDVWIEDINMWNDFMNLLSNGKEKSVIVITTRSMKVASSIGTYVHQLDTLSDHVCRFIFTQLAFRKDEEERYPNLVDLGRSIVEKCGGVPLVVKTLAGVLRNERDENEWRRIKEIGSFLKLDDEHYNGVMLALELSYDKLRPHLKQCFAYLSLVMKGSRFHRRLFSLYWSALGLLEPSEDKELQLNGDKIFKELLSRCFLQDPFLVFNNDVISCKMHDLLHDLAMKVLAEGLAIITTKELNVSETTRYMIWGYEGFDGLSNKNVPMEITKAKKARSLVFGYIIGQVSKSFLEGILSSLEFLRILDFNGLYFEVLPRSIGNLKHLRFLSLARNPLIKVLPNTICKLLNLQTLILEGCEQLQELPRDLHYLINLRYLSVTTTQESLVGTKLHCLTSLQTLLLVCCNNLASLWSEAAIARLVSLKGMEIVGCAKITSLPNCIIDQLNNLERLHIINCRELDFENGSNLSGLSNLKSLTLQGLPKMVQLPQGIQSSTRSLQYLQILDCESLIALPDYLQHLTSLRKLCISSCASFSSLPYGFRHLKCMEEFHLNGCPNLTKHAQPGGKYYPHIQHIPKIFLDDISSSTQ